MTNKEKIINIIDNYQDIINNVHEKADRNIELYNYTIRLSNGIELLNDVLLNMDEITDIEKDKIIEKFKFL